jgi:hypothetical protein
VLPEHKLHSRNHSPDLCHHSPVQDNSKFQRKYRNNSNNSHTRKGKYMNIKGKCILTANR